jgi:uncharacterized membrane protein YfcA
VEDYTFYLGALSAFILGLSKSGIKGIAIFAVTLMALAYGSKVSTGIVMPLLLFGDIFAVIYYRRHVEWTHIRKLLPFMVIGVLVGVFIGNDLPEKSFKYIMSTVILVSVVLMFYWDQRKSTKIPSGLWFGSTMGLAAGFTTMVGNLAGAFSNLYFLAMRLPKNKFIGTAAILFFIINLVKLPFHVFIWKTINFDSILINSQLVLFMIAGLLLGIYIVDFIKELVYRRMILVLTAVGAILIFLR